MIVVRVELHSAVTGRVSELARAHICNDGGTDQVRNYIVSTLRGRSREALDQAIVQRHGRVDGHHSLKLHVWHLVAKALAAMGYGTDPASARMLGRDVGIRQALLDLEEEGREP